MLLLKRSVVAVLCGRHLQVNRISETVFMEERLWVE